MKKNNQPIGIFDSGIGGLTVLAELKKILPTQDFIYCADLAHIPYGNKTEMQITAYSQHIMEWMINHYNIKVAIIACHTSSAVCGEYLKKKFTIPIIDTIGPTIESVMAVNPPKIGILGTQRTIATHIHKQHLIQNGYQGHITEIACPLFVPLVEEGLINTQQIDNAINFYCTPVKVDAFLYACTHYPFLEPRIKKILNPRIKLINPNRYIAIHTKTVLSSYHIHTTANTLGTTLFHTTDKAINITSIAHKMLALL
jgi:glutamate racemase